MKRFFATICIFILIFGIVYSAISGLFGVASSRSDVTVDIQKIAEERIWKSEISQKWQEKYGIKVRSEIDEKIDHDNDGLTLLDEYLYDTDPTNPDTDGDGYNDGREVTNGYSPSSEGLLDTNNNNVPDTWEREKFGRVLADEKKDHDNDGLTLLDEYLYNTDPTNPDTDGDGYNDGREVFGAYDPTVSGDARINMTLVIKKINVEAPIIFSKISNEDVIQKNLQKGVVHYPGTAYPGERGNMYIAGHSSNYIWAKGAYNYVFKNLDNLLEDDQITVVARLANGKEITYTYLVKLNEEVEPDDARIFADTQSQELTLTTCWPLGTNTKRLMIKAYLQEA
ncbi:MAG: hypothetical protein CR972_02260 [Candidatus Moraniibacteriota bacterium]|nr:MAG: hypothetical protein CR972_02260 [Candidatus Moranbacteria bacterium]